MNIVKQNRLPEFKLSNKPKLIISKEIQSQIMYLHSRISDVEWSAELLYSIEQGSILDLDNFVIKAKGLFPLDRGTATYTEHETTVDICDLMDMYPEYEDGKLKRGYCHTHHNMTTFMSAVDIQELHDNAGQHNYYLSLIVNHKSQYCAKIAIVAENKKEVVSSEVLVFKGDNAQPVEMPLTIQDSTDNKCLVLIDCIIEFEQDADFIAKVDEICSRPVKALPVATTKQNNFDKSNLTNLSKTNQYSNKYAVDVEDEVIGSDWYKNWNKELEVEFDDETDVQTIDKFLRKVLSTKSVNLINKVLFPRIIDGIKLIDKQLPTAEKHAQYLVELSERINNNLDTFFGKDANRFKVIMDVGDYVDGLVPMNEVNNYDDLYSDISNLIWSLK